MENVDNIKENDLNKVSGGRDENISRDLDINPNESSIGTTSDINIIPPEVRSK